ncbi:protein CrcB [Streptomyces sp. B1I3]|nr:protein CrcB [Streptomyces sp. B1I3]
MSDLLLVVAGGAVGAVLRYLTDRAVQTRHDTVFPWGTFTVNVVGSLSLGLLTGAVAAGAAGHSLQLLLGVGLCGALTTYSTFSYETLRLAESGAQVLRRGQCDRLDRGRPRCRLRGHRPRGGPVHLTAAVRYDLNILNNRNHVM